MMEKTRILVFLYKILKYCEKIEKAAQDQENTKWKAKKLHRNYFLKSPQVIGWKIEETLYFKKKNKLRLVIFKNKETNSKTI